MNEKLLQFIWRYQYFQFTDLCTTDGEKMTIIQNGQYNDQQGPDFLQARILMDNTLLVGNIELHVKSSDWNLHKHAKDHQYDNIILHVVWMHDTTVITRNPFPTLELQSHVPKILLEKYNLLSLQSPQFIACQQSLPILSELSWINWKERLAVERLKRKSNAIIQKLHNYQNDWASLFWEEIAAAFGIKSNTEAFRSIAQTIPLNIIRKNRNSLLTIEALLLGQAGLLTKDFEEEYPKKLQKEYQYIQQKYQLKQVSFPVIFLRMHPYSFPTIRLAQLAMLLHLSAHLFTQIIDAVALEEIYSLLEVAATDYWDDHYILDKKVEQKIPKKIGKAMMDTILINCIIPVVYSYGVHKDNMAIQEKSLQWLSEIKSESNTIIKKWNSFNISAHNALESQSLLELYHQYCKEKQCLSCNVGIQYLQSSSLVK